MKRIFLLLIVIVFSYSSTLLAQGPFLRVAVAQYTPPFVIRAGGDQFYGFDISLMEYVCKKLERTCRFMPMHFDQILNSVAENKVDVGISSITITADRAKLVHFSIPYLPSKSRFLTRDTKANQPFSLSLLANKKIGVLEGTVFKNQIQQMGAQNVEVVVFVHEEEMIEALTTEEIDFVLMDAQTSLYWQSHSSGVIKVTGPVFPYGFGYGIAVKQDDATLLAQINDVLKEYLISTDYKKNYSMYIQN